MSLEEAVGADRREDLQSAATGYEEVLADGERSLEVLLNLAVLYWQATDIGLASAKKLRPDFIATAGRRLPELLDEARRRFPENTEAHFWQRYIAWADLGEPFGSEECRKLLQQDPATLVPAMHLFASSQGKEARAEVSQLLRWCEDDGTARARYVASVIHGVMKRSGHRH